MHTQRIRKQIKQAAAHESRTGTVAPESAAVATAERGNTASFQGPWPPSRESNPNEATSPIVTP